MKKIFTLLLFALAPIFAFGTVYYVGGAGASDSNPGTDPSLPCATIQKAASAAVGGDVIIIRAGTYRETIRPTNSGSSGNPITFQADAGATVVISGLNTIDGSGWTVHGGSIYKKSITLPVNGYSHKIVSNVTLLANQLFKDGEMQIEARWPNVNSVDELFDQTLGRRFLQPQNFGSTSLQDVFPVNVDGAAIIINGAFSTVSQTVSQVGNSLSYPAVWAPGDSKFRRNYYLTGKLTLLDQAKEWHYENGTLYYWQQGGGIPSGLEYKARNWGFDCRDRQYINLTGLQFKGCEPLMGNDYTSYCVIDNITATYTNHNVRHDSARWQGVGMTRQMGVGLRGTNNVLKNSRISYAASGGVWIGANGRVENNDIHHIGYDASFCYGVDFWGEDNVNNVVVTKNTIHTTSRGCVGLGYMFTEFDNRRSLNCDISYNDFYDWGKLNQDGGAIYAWGFQDHTGTRIHHNWFHDSGYKKNPLGIILDGVQVAVYFDQGSGPFMVDHNVFWNNVPVSDFTQDASDIYDQQSFTGSAGGSRNNGGSKFYNNTIWSDAAKSYITYCNTPADQIYNNIVRKELNFNWGAGARDTLKIVGQGKDPKFVGGSLASPQNYFQLQSTSPAKDRGNVYPGITDGSIGTPDIGAYEYGAPPWTAGYTAVTVVTPTPPAATALIKLQFNEANGVAPVSSGSSAATFTRSATTPSSSTNVPALVGGANSLDFGTTVGNYYVESSAAIDALKGMSNFTITGWLNSKSNTIGTGGNRIITWSNGLLTEGVDLVMLGNGSLQIGIDGYPDNSSAVSSASKITANASAPASNWVFFAITYQSNPGQVKFYFGNNTTDATLDVTQTYAQGVTGTGIGKLAVGNFNDAIRSSTMWDRMFRGLIDDIQVHGSALTLSEILYVQRGTGDAVAPTAPGSLASPSKTSTSINLTWTASTDNVAVTGYDIYNGSTLLTSIAPAVSTTLTGLTVNTSYTLTIKAKDAAGNSSAASNAITVTTDAGVTPLISLKFNEATGVAPVNVGSAPATFIRSATTPASSGNVPVSVGGANSLDFGTTVGNYYIESTAAIDALKGMNNFTITGWLNSKSNTIGTGGNRIITWSNGIPTEGVDLVMLADGSLQIGIDGYPDNSSAISSPNKITANASAPASNWVFFALTYQSSPGQVQFYFGNNATDATLDVTKTYAQGVTGTGIGKLAVGNFNDAIRSSTMWDRMFRGLIDDIQVYGSALTLSQIVSVQRGTGGGDAVAPSAPTSLASASKTSTTINLTWTASTDNVAVTGYDIYNGSTLLTSIAPAVSTTLTGLTANTSYTLTLKAKDAAGNVSAASNSIMVTTDAVAAPLISLRFNEASGVAPVNVGSLPATFTRSATTPSSSTNVPALVGGANSFDFGTTVGNYYVESSTAIDGLKGMNNFTITGWLNCKSSTIGTGGNRIISWINGILSEGVDLVYLADGSLQIGIDGYPDNSTAISSVNKITTNASAPASNWVFFAITYQSTPGQVKFYFGNNATDATLDVTKSYAQGVTGTGIAKLAVGNFNDAIRSSTTWDRMFRGLIDNIQVYGSALNLSEIVSVQRGTGGSSLPSPWVTQDIGSVGYAGSASWSSGTFTVTGSGTDIWNNTDEFRYVYRPLNGDGEITARVATLGTGYLNAKAGVMIRENLTGGSKHALVNVTPGPQRQFLWRSTAGATTTAAFGASIGAPSWVRLKRVGNVFTAFESSDGTNWTQLGTAQTISMGTSVYMGLAVLARDNTTTITATFDNVTLQDGSADTTPPSAPASLTSPSKTSTSINLTWTASTDNVGVTGYDIYNGSTLLTSIAPGVSTTLTGLAANTAYTLTVKAKDAAGNVSTASNSINVTTDAILTPLISLKFNEANGVAPYNNGSAPATFARSATTPSSSTNVPALVGGANSLDFGTTVGNYYVESSAAIDALKGMNNFTITGWLNSKSNTIGTGGNRIITWSNGILTEGVDLVMLANGSLQIGIDGYPDNSTAISSVNKITASASAPATNWVFFAVTYQSSPGQVQFYFGNNATDATLDVTKSYAQGVTGTGIGKLAVGNFNDAIRSSTMWDRMFRGLIDDIQVYGSALTLSQIVSVQRGTGGAGPIPSPWVTQDIGSVGFPGSATWSAGTFTVTGSGTDIWNTTDEFRYVYRPLTGDGEITARVATLGTGYLNAKAGVMIREDLTGGSKHALVNVTPGPQRQFLWRSTAGATTTAAFGASIGAPSWVRLKRVGNVFTAFESSDGTNWTQIGTAQTVSMTSTVYIGLAVLARDNTTSITATFDNVSLKDGAGNPMTRQAVNAEVAAAKEAPDVDVATGAAIYQNYPNPSTGTTAIRMFIPSPIRTATFDLYDPLGVTLGTRDIVERGDVVLEIATERLKPGVYVYRLTADGKQIGVKRLMVTK